MNSLNNFTDRLLKEAARKNEEYVLHQGHTLKKGQWVTLPNKKHVFVLDGKIQAGPPALLGKNPKQLSPEDLSDQTESMIPQSKAVSDKYAEELWNTQHLTPAKKQIALEQLQHRMDSENDGNLHFFPGSAGKNLDSLAQDFSDFGPRNPKDSPENQAIWYNDRLQLMKELGSALGPEGRSQVGPHIENIQDKIQRLRGTSPAPSLPEQMPKPKPSPARATPSVESPSSSDAPPQMAPSSPVPPKIKKKIRRPESAIPPSPQSSSQYGKLGPDIIQDNNGAPAPTPPPPKPSPSPYGLKGRDIVDRKLVMPKNPVYYQMRGRDKAASQFKNMEMIQIEADLRNLFLDTIASLGDNVSHPVTKEVLSHISNSKMQKNSKLF